MGRPSYAVRWREAGGPICTGRLELGPAALHLEGGEGSGPPVVLDLGYRELVSVRIGHSRDERVEGLPALFVERAAGGSLQIASLAGAGTLLELSELLASARLGELKDGSIAVDEAWYVPLERLVPPAACERLRVVVAGAGVAALEATLALRALAEDAIELELLAPEPEFFYRPLAVAEPFELGEAHRFSLGDLAAACGARHREDSLVSVDVERRRARTARGAELGYDALVVALGARACEALPGALAFGGPGDAEAYRRLLAELEAGAVRRVAFALPAGPAWPLPLYELALLTAWWLVERDVREVELALATPEQAPLALFGQAASAAIRKLLEAHGIALLTGSYPAGIEPDALVLVPRGRVPADRVVSLPRLEGPRVPGLPHDRRGFIPTDGLGRVRGAPGVYAAGDVTAFPVKQGGLAAAQADAVAEAITAVAGVPVEPRPFRPVLRGLLLTGEAGRYLRAELDGGRGDTSQVASHALWWPPGKIVGRYLAPYLAERAGLDITRAPEGISVEVELPSGAGDDSAAPPPTKGSTRAARTPRAARAARSRGS